MGVETLPIAEPRAAGPAPVVRQLLALAAPLIVANVVVMLQLSADRVILGRLDADHVAAALPTSMLFWAPFSLLQGVVAYVATFVAQYRGAGRPERGGPALWQGMILSVAGGLAFMLLYFVAADYVALAGHEPRVQELEVEYFRCLVFLALPSLITATGCAFFSGVGSPWQVIAVNLLGNLVNGVLVYGLVFGELGLPAWGMTGAGVGTVVAAWSSAALTVTLLLRPKFAVPYRLLRPRFEADLMRRLLKYGGPAGFQVMLDGLVFTLFIVYAGRLGRDEAAATSIASTLNLLAFLPAIGMGQAVAVLVGQRLGEGRPDLAERSANAGVGLTALYMLLLAGLFLGLPLTMAGVFRPPPEVAAMIPTLLAMVAVYSFADAASVVFAGALRGAGDTRFVTVVATVLSVAVMVVPTFLVVSAEPGSLVAGLSERVGGKLYAAWGCATAYILAVAVVFWLRFRSGKWKAMRVIEAAPAVD